MAEPIPFPQQNANLTAPSGSPDVLDLPVHRANGMIVSKWRLTKPEIEEMARTGVVWLWVLGDRMPPVSIRTNDPFGQDVARGAEA